MTKIKSMVLTAVEKKATQKAEIIMRTDDAGLEYAINSYAARVGPILALRKEIEGLKQLLVDRQVCTRREILTYIASEIAK